MKINLRYYRKYFKELPPKKAIRKLIKWLKKHPEFTGEILIENRWVQDGLVEISIKFMI